MISAAAEEKIATDPSFSMLNRVHESIVSFNHHTEQYVPPIEGTQYNSKNYMERKIVRTNDLENAKGGDVIDFLTKQTSYAGGNRYIAKKVPIYQKDHQEKGTAMARALTIDTKVKVDHSLTLPDISSPRNQGAATELINNIGLSGRNSKRNSTVVAPSKTNMDVKLIAKTVSATPTNGS